MSTIQNLRKSLVRNWKPVCSLVGDTLSGAEFAPFRLWLSPTCLSAPGGRWASLLPASSPLVLAQSFAHFLWESSLSLFLSLSSFSFSLSLAIPQFVFLSQISSLRLPSGHSGKVLTLSNAARASLPSPCLLVADVDICDSSLLGEYYVSHLGM